MFNKNAKYLVVLTGLTPILFICWIVMTLQRRGSLSIFLPQLTLQSVFAGICELWINHWLLFAFLISLIICKYLLKIALNQLSSVDIDAKTLKPAEVNFTPILFSIMAGWLKFYFTDVKDLIFLVGTTVLCLVYAAIFRDSYHFNIIYKVAFGYRHYEIQDNNVTYLLISKTIVLDPSEIKEGIKLTDYMIINTTPKNNKSDDK